MYILDYDSLFKKLNQMKNLKKQKSIKTRLGYEIPYYTYGNGEKNIVFVGGTHSSEIISVDFVLKLMDFISNKKGYFKNIDEKKYTFHFIPVQNIEGFIVVTSAIGTMISNGMGNEDIEKICKEYYLKYREDDIYSKNNPKDKSIKKHQKMFENVTYKCIDNKHQKIRQSIKDMYKNNDFPNGSLITFRANASGVELNRNTIYNKGIEDIKNNKITYGNDRYNNIKTNVSGPIGVPCLDVYNFEYENENKFLFELLSNLKNSNQLSATFLFHSTGGQIYYEPVFEAYNSKLDNENKQKILRYNKQIASIYQKYTDYKFIESKDDKLCSFDGLLRTLFKGTLLIELSKMGGNPLAPYGDIKNNYLKTIEDNLRAIYEIVKNFLL